MPTITPALNTTIPGVPRVIWDGMVTGDTINAFTLQQQFGLAASVQVVGTFGGATVTLQVSNDGTNWATARDVLGNLISFTAAGYAEMSVSAAYIRFAIAGGAANDIDAIVVLRGANAL